MCPARPGRVLGRYLLGQPMATGGMATVHLGRLLGPGGFSRTVAVKRLHAHLAQNPDFVQRFVDEARIASRVRHGNVVQTLDVVVIDDEVLLVLDYVHGESFARLCRRAQAAAIPIPPSVAAGIVIGVLRGLHAAHEAKSVKGTSLDLVHRDVSPQNILVGADGVARVLDFGLAKAAGRESETLTKEIEGKLEYMPPEQVVGADLDRRTDLFAVGVVLWEALAGERLFRGEDVVATMEAIHHRDPPRLSERELGISAAVDDVLARALAKDIHGRFETALSMARALESALPAANDREIADWVEAVAGDILVERAEHVALFEGEEPGSSKARLFAARTPPSGTAARPSALVPPPLESVTDEHTMLRGSAPSMPTLQMEAAAALAASLPPAAAAAQGESESDKATTTAGAGTMPAERDMRAMHTPLAMVGPPRASSHAPESGVTRVDPVERRPRYRAPIPIPFSIPPPPRPESGNRFLTLTALVVAPPLIVILGIFGMRAAADARVGKPAAAMQVIAAAPPAAEPAPALATAAAPLGPSLAADAGAAEAKPNSGARPRPTRPGHRRPRAARPSR